MIASSLRTTISVSAARRIRLRVAAVAVSIEQMAGLLDSLKTPHLFRFAITSLCTWARPQAIIDFDPTTQVDWNGGSRAGRVGTY